MNIITDGAIRDMKSTINKIINQFVLDEMIDNFVN
jgi:hypothetical protein